MATEESTEEKKQKVKRLTAKKRDIQSEKRCLINKSFKSQVRTSLRSLDESFQSRDKKNLEIAVRDVFSLMDKGVKRKIFKQNKAARFKSKAAAKLASLV